MSPSEVSLVVLALSKIEKKTGVSFFDSKFEKFVFIAMVFIFSLIVIAGIAFLFYRNSIVEIIAIGLTLLFYLVALIWQISLITPIFKFFKNPTEQLLQVFQERATREISSMSNFSIISLETLEYLSQRLLLAKEQLHQRMAYLMGAVDKVGVLPGFIASFLALSKVLESKTFPVENKQLYIYAAIGFCILYVFSMVSMMICQRFEVYSGILKHYLASRKNDKN